MQKTLLATLIGLTLSPCVGAADFSLNKANTANTNTDEWQCERCTPVTGTRGHFAIGASDNQIDDIHFANESGTDKDGLVPRLDGNVTHWYSNDVRTAIEADQLGYDVSTLAIGADRARDFAAELSWRQLAWYDATVPTPYRTSNGHHQLPADWQQGATTQQMPGLDGPLNPVDLKLERDQFQLGLEKYFNAIRTYLDVTHQQRKGYRQSGATLITNAVNLPQQVDDNTTSLAAGLNVVGGNWQVAFGYLGSQYENDLSAQRWDNPYTPTFGSAREGQQAVAPDNTAHQFHVQGTWAAGIQSLSGQVVWGRHDQDETFLPATINGPSPDLPASDADLQLDKLDLNLRYRLRPMRKMTLLAEYDYQDRDYRNPLQPYPYIITDSIPAGSRTPPDLDITDQKASLAINYRFYRGFSGELGYRWRQQEWTDQPADQATTNQYWAILRLNHWERLALRLELGGEDRELNNFLGSPDAEGVNDPALRPYYLADRDRYYGKLVASYQILDPLGIQITLEGSEEDYDDPLVGLDTVDRTGYDINLNYHQEALSFYLFYNAYNLDTRQIGSNTGTLWQGRQDDDAQSAGLGAEYRGAFSDRLDLGVDLVWADSDTLTRTEQGLGNDLGAYDATRTTLDIYGRYHLSDHSSVQLDLLYQEYEDSSFLNQGLQPNSIGNVLTFGDLSHDYSDYLINLSYRHEF
ncbi:MtrB/PioB family decaheme-associated outer membrane protein [Ferrimonas balearica]|uniref:MtrB/PioB family decaheme-associated outer membrane protein n=1 Tax=Ferrimonas balearica TaxID=44012 RepID=UPI001C99A097|nr:MtrB/PioB family decaheme-associated outer membrane protein [Ferrimonas balearica]MBY5920994.1 MtrB/PioB family decaheme-associated outer membrane protein [Ferrimonas balearica]MBY5996321.1 MtrB/PioB family decaheme-associated outer membrane protein [Ferrimonas balearica]